MKKAKIWMAAALLGLILVQPEAAIAGAQRAMAVWCTSVAPALFPFLALMPLLTGPEACAAYAALLSGVMDKLFHLPGSAAGALVIGLISGSPGGAIAIRRVGESASLTKQEISRLACCICGISPAFLILGVGQGMYGSAKLGFALAGIQLVIQLSMLVCTRGKRNARDLAPLPPQEPAQGVAIGGAVERVLVVCGYMVLFSSVSGAVAALTGEAAGLAILLVADLPSGLARLAGTAVPGKMLLQGAAIGFGGLCIAMQNLDVLRPAGVRAKEYFAARGLNSALFAGACGIVFPGAAGKTSLLGGNAGSLYVISLLLAGIFSIPCMIFLSKNLFLNIRKLDEISKETK